MTGPRFDDLTKTLGKSTSRRAVLKALALAAVGGVLSRAGGGDAEARARVRMACARLGQPCNTIPGTPGNKICCPHLACDADLTCCKPQNESCVDDGDCCAGNVCRPNPKGLGNRCLPPGGVGAACVETADFSDALVCEPYSGLCLEITGTPCTANNQCVSGICDDYTGICAGACLDLCVNCASSADCCAGLQCVNFQCLANDGTACIEDSDCASGLCDEYTGFCIGSCLTAHTGCFEAGDCCAGLTCFGSVCLGADGTPCAANGDCVSNFCEPYTRTCVTCVADGSACAANLECCSGICDAYSGACIATLLPTGSPCLAGEDCATGLCDAYSSTCVTCLPAADACQANSDCCVGICDNYTGVCGPCRADLDPCAESADCCGGFCDFATNTCSNYCVNNTGACSADGECCSKRCANGVCAACLVDTSTCGRNGDCCTGNCTNNICGACLANGGACTAGSQCCNLHCQNNGTCGGCANDGAPCSSHLDCCGDDCSGGFCRTL